jgi:hypothetical protein
LRRSVITRWGKNGFVQQQQKRTKEEEEKGEINLR